jgi:hypothetical protein
VIEGDLPEKVSLYDEATQLQWAASFGCSMSMTRG